MLHGPPKNNGNLPGLTPLRGLAAVAVMAFHFNLFFLPQARLTNVFPLLGRAYMAVDLFFLLSGFVMAHVYGELLARNPRRHAWSFLRARLARIYPLHLATFLVLVTFAAAAGASTTSIAFSADAAVLNPFLLQSLYSRLNWNYPTWSISTEAMAYVLFIFGAAPLLRGRHPFWIAAGLYGGLVALCSLKHGSLNSFTQTAAIARTFAGFGLGVLLYRAWRADLFGTHRLASVAALPLLIAAHLLRLDALCVAAFAALIVLAVDMPPPLNLWLNSRPLEWLGDWSYGIYLWHAPVHFAVAAGLERIGIRVTTLTAGPSRLLTVGTAALVIGIAALSYRYIERPGRQLLRAGVLVGRHPLSRKDGSHQPISER